MVNLFSVQLCGYVSTHCHPPDMSTKIVEI